MRAPVCDCTQRTRRKLGATVESKNLKSPPGARGQVFDEIISDVSVRQINGAQTCARVRDNAEGMFC